MSDLGLTDQLDNTELIKIPKKKEKKPILIFNNNAITTISMIVVLRKKYEVHQSSNFDDFLEMNVNDNITKAILDFDSLSDTQKNKLEQNEAKNFIIIYNTSLEANFEEKSLLKIEKKELKNSINKI